MALTKHYYVEGAKDGVKRTAVPVSHIRIGRKKGRGGRKVPKASFENGNKYIDVLLYPGHGLPPVLTRVNSRRLRRLKR